MNFESCRKCGTRYEIGYPCPTCTTQKQQERLHQEAREHSDDLAKRRDGQNEADRDYNENLFEREQAAAEERSAAEHRRNEEQTERLIAEQETAVKNSPMRSKLLSTPVPIPAIISVRLVST